jgi:hypothetical protein
MLPSEVQVEAVCPAQLRNVRKGDRSKSRAPFEKREQPGTKNSVIEAAASKVSEPLIRQSCPFRKVQEIKDSIMGTESRGSRLDGWPSIVTGKRIDAKCQLMRHSSLGHFLALQPIIMPFPSTVLTCASFSPHLAFLQRLLQAGGLKLSLSSLHLISQPKSISKVSGMPVDILPTRHSQA